MKTNSKYLKVAIFATGISGLVAEFILSTLASYFIGDTIVQWTIVLSIMLFSMGIGSQLSKSVKQNLLFTFLLLEFALSLLISISPLLVYSVAGYTAYIHIVVYGLASLIGLCIGFEIPLVTRLNEQFESLDKNVSNVMSWDYVGSLIGGIAFAFWGLPHLGLKNTAFVFGMLNLVVALFLFFVFWNKKIKNRKVISGMAVFVVLVLSASFLKSDDIIIFGEQKRFKDKVVFVKQSKYQKMVITSWLNHHWLYINGNLQMTTVDEFLYHEPMVHPIMELSKEHKSILIIGGGDGFNAKELLKYPDVQTITLVDLDPEMTKLGLEYTPFVMANDSSLHNSKVKIINTDGFIFLQKSTSFYDIVIVDLPDAKGVDLNKLYTTQFYNMAFNHLRPNGFMVTQAGSPYYATKAFECISKTMQHSGFKTLKLHNQVLSMGEWGWIIGSKSFSREQMKFALINGNFPKVETRWINQESIELITSFGKPLIDTTQIKINTINDPVLYQYQLNANWDLY